MKLLINWLISGLAVFIASRILPGVSIADLKTALVVAAVLGIINVFVKPILTLLTLPITLLTFGLFSVVVNAFIIILVDGFVTGFSVSGFFTAVIFSLVLSLVNSVLYKIAE